MSLDSLADGWAKAIGVDRKHFNMFFERMMDGFAYHKIVVDKAGKPVDYIFLEVNNAFERMTGLKREKIIGKKVTEVLKGIENDPADWIGRYGKVALTCEPTQFENYAEALGKWFNISAYCPEKSYFVALFEDITERKKTEELQQITLQRFYDSLSNMNGAILLVSADGHVEFANESFVEYFHLKESPEALRGFGAKEIIDKIKGAYLHPEQEVARIRQIVAAGKPVIGEEVIFMDNRTCLRDFIPLNKNGISYSRLWHHMDITSRKKAEEALRESENRFRSVLDNSLDIIYRFNLQTGIYEYTSPAIRSMGFEPEEIVAMSSEQVFSRVHPDDRQTFQAGLAEISKTGKGTIEYRFKGKKGLYKWWSVQFVIVNDEKGKPLYRDGFGREITERKKFEQALKESEQRWSTTLSSIGDAVIATDTEGKITFLNGVAEKLTGWTFDEAKGKSIKQIFNIINEKTRQDVENPVAKVLEKGLVVGLANHTVLVCKDGSEIPIDDSGAPIKDKDGKITGVVLVFRDITERKKTDAQLSQQAFMIENANDAIVGYDVEQKVTFWNKSAQQMYGYTAKEALGKSSIELLHPVYTEAVREKLVNKLSTEGHVETESIRQTKDGRSIDVEAHVILLRDETGKSQGYVSVDRDITERKKTEAAIKRQADLIDLSPDAIIVRLMDGTITFWSKGAEKLYGWTKSEAVGKTTHSLFQTKLPQSLQSIIDELKATKRWSGELIHKTKDKREITVQSWWLAEKTDHGEITSILESNVDLTERKKSEKEIARLATFPTLNPSPIFEVDFKGNVTYVNPATKTLFPELEKLGLKHPFLSDWQDIAEAFTNKTKTLFGREVKVGEHWYHQQFYIVPQTQQIRIYTLDIDELKIAEEARIKAQEKLEENAIMLEEYANQMEELANKRAEQLKDAERMAAIGQTAGMVGHDIRNPLQAITSDLYLITEEVKSMRDGESKQAVVESIDSITENLSYINKIVSDLQDYTRPLKPNIQKINLFELIEGTLLSINVPNRIEITTDIKENSKTIETDVAYLRRILTNLMTNAVQAMPNEGVLTVKAFKKKDKTYITIQDTGVGIPEHVKAKMFTPLFTTKSKGQGLGLAVVKRLAEALKGTVVFESQENQGTKFTLEFPQATD